MNKKDNALDIFQDLAIFEQGSKSATDDEDQTLLTAAAENEALQQALDFEQSLRSSFAGAITAEQKQEQEIPSVSADNFSALLNRIDAVEDATLNSAPIDQNDSENHSSNQHNVVTLLPSMNLKKWSIAASFIAVCAVSLNVSNHLLAPKFETLSAPEQGNDTATIDFGLLVSERRLAKLALQDITDSATIEALLEKYQLQTISVAPQQDSLIVQTTQSINSQMLTTWRADPLINNIEIIEFNNNTSVQEVDNELQPATKPQD